MMHVVFSRPLSFFVIAGQVSDYTGVSVLLDSLPMAQWTLADRIMMLTGSEMAWWKKGADLASGDGDSVENQSNTTS